MTTHGQCDWPLLATMTRAVKDSDPQFLVKIAEGIRAELPFYGSDSVVSSTEAVAFSHALVAAITDPQDDVGTRWIVPCQIGERHAREGMSLVDVLDPLRVGTKLLWAEIVNYSRHKNPVTDTELVELASELWLMYDDYVQATSAGYRRELSQVMLSRPQERLSLINGLLTARGPGATSPWDAADRLGLPRTGGFVVAAATGRLPLSQIEQTLADADIASAWVLTGSCQMGMFGVANPAWLDILKRASDLSGATVGVSPVQHDYGRVSSAVRLARTALAAAAPRTVSLFGSAPISMSAAGSPEISRPIVEAVLGPLLQVAEPDRSSLIETLDAWFDVGGSYAAVAERLEIHQNTVRNRIGRIRAVTGRDVGHPQQSAELYFALCAYRLRSHAHEDLHTATRRD